MRNAGFTVRYELEKIKKEETFTDYNKLFLCSKKIEFSLEQSINKKIAKDFSSDRRRRFLKRFTRTQNEENETLSP